MSFKDACKKYQVDADEVEAWCKEQYLNLFSTYFEDVESLRLRLFSEYRPVTDDELEKILTTIPLQLFGVSEVLNTFKVRMEVIKLQVKQEKYELAHIDDEELTQTQKKDLSEYKMIDSEKVLKAYASVIEQVDRQMAYSRELIMSAKKIWAARRDTESMGGEIDSSDTDNLPEYKMRQPIG